MAEPPPWVAIGTFVTGVAAWIMSAVVGLFRAHKEEGDLTLSGLNALVAAQQTWMGTLEDRLEKAEKRVTKAEAHGDECDARNLVLETAMRDSGIPIPPRS